MEEKIKAVQKMLDADHIWSEVYQYNTLPVIAVSIHWGDWKHEHWRTDYLMEQAGYSLIKTEVTEEDGSDTYSGIHYYLAV